MKTPTGRLRTAMDPAKAFRHYDELRRTMRLKRALIIAETTDGHYQVLAQMTDAPGAAGLCMVAAEALAQIPEGQRGGEAPRPPPASPPPPMTAALAPPIHSIAAAWPISSNRSCPTVPDQYSAGRCVALSTPGPTR